jgi:hypothetical protein
MKTLLYSVYSLKKDMLYQNGSAHIRIETKRPLAYGARVSLELLGPDTSYQVGDTARIVASWRNMVRSNESLLWRLKGRADTLAFKAAISPTGMDTLAFPCAEKGVFEISATVKDVDGYVSWEPKSVVVDSL